MPQEKKGSGISTLLEVVRELEKERDSRIWCMVHRGRGHICGPTMYALYSGRDGIGKGKKVELLLHSPGGHPQIAYKAMKFFRSRFKEVNVIVPLLAKSSATLMCLGADRIFMGELAELGPIDIQIDDPVIHGEKSFSPIDEFKSIEFMREQAIEWIQFYAVVMHREYGMSIKEALKDSVPLVSGLMRPLFEQIEPLEMGGNRRSLAIAEEYANRMLELSGNENARSIVRQFVWEYPSHDFCIDFEEAKKHGLPVERLTETQDRRLTKAIIQLGKEDSYHGFPPPPSSRATKRGKVHKAGAQPKNPTRGRVNGHDNRGPEERVQA
jgi:hypothetical protein